MLGRLVKVTPSSKVVGDLALHLVGAGVEAKDFEADPGKFDVPDSVIGFLRGELGDPPGGWPEPFRTRALEGRPPERGRAELSDEDREGLAQCRRPTLNRLLFPGPTKEYLAHRESYGNTSVLSTKDFLYGLEPEVEHTVELEPGVTLIIELEAISEPDERGYRTVVTSLNGQLRPVSVRDARGRHRRQGRGEGRPRQPAPRRRAVRGRGDAAGRRGRRGGGGPDGRDDRGDEDGGEHHRAAGGNGRRGWPSARCSRSRAATSCWSWSSRRPTVDGRAGPAAGAERRGGHNAAVTRIVAGVAGGRRLAVPPSGTRPTSDRVREALFSALAHDPGLDGAAVLDLCAGSGALGLEALSRGAAHVLFVECDRRAAAVLRRNVAAVDLPGAQVRGRGCRGCPRRPRHDQAIRPAARRPALRHTRHRGGRVARRRARRTGGSPTTRPSWSSVPPVVAPSRGPRRCKPLRERRYGETTLHLGRCYGPCP